ncbi:MAG: WD40 repeat domain-containing protein [Promethearchaeota archaeon]
MRKFTKIKAINLITLGFIFVILPVVTSNLYLNVGNDNNNFINPYDIEDLATSSIPVVPLWSYDTKSRNREVAISSNGQYIAVACYDFNLYLFEKDNSTPLWTSNLGECVQSVAITPDGQYIVAGTVGPPNRVYLFEKDSSIPLWSYDTGGWVMSLAISSNGQYIAAGIGQDDYGVIFFEKNSSTPLWRKSVGGRVNSVGISSDGNYIVAGSYNRKLFLFGRHNSTPIWTYTTPNWAYHVAISSDGNYIVVGDTDGSNPAHGIYFFERSNSTPLWNYTTWDHVWSVAISSDGQYIAVGTGYNGNQIYFFEKNSSTPLWIFDAGGSIRSVAISSDRKYIIGGGYDEKVYLFSKNSSTPLWSYKVLNSIESLAISSDGQYFAAGISTGTNYVFPVYLFHLAIIPYIAINFPLLNQISGISAPEFNITIYNLSPINKTWYTIDDGLINYTFSGSTGFINQTAWDTLDDGILTIRFYANDSLGNVGFKDVQISKDTVIPDISILSPFEDEIFGTISPVICGCCERPILCRNVIIYFYWSKFPESCLFQRVLIFCSAINIVLIRIMIKICTEEKSNSKKNNENPECYDFSYSSIHIVFAKSVQTIMQKYMMRLI